MSESTYELNLVDVGDDKRAKVQAIKGYRRVSGADLMAAKEFVESVIATGSGKFTRGKTITPESLKEGLNELRTAAGFRLVETVVMSRITDGLKDLIKYAVETNNLEAADDLLQVLKKHS